MNHFEGYRVSSKYGENRINQVTFNSEIHKGIDLVKADKSDICAFVEGKCMFAGETQVGTGLGYFGNSVVIKDKNGAAHIYAHLHSVSIKKDDDIKKGQVLGKQGNTGRSSGSHLHYEVRKLSSPSYGYGTTIDPVKYLDDYYSKSVPAKTEVKPEKIVSKKTVRVKIGDTLSKIAQENKIEVDAIIKLNPQIKNPNSIQIGQTIKLS
jgi:murein DD-endopeptidase MepM/ murein hydrolase activator NlpD